MRGPRIPTLQAQTLTWIQNGRPLRHTAALRASPSEAPLATRRQAGLLGSRSDAMAANPVSVRRGGAGRGGAGLASRGSGLSVREVPRAGLACRKCQVGGRNLPADAACACLKIGEKDTRTRVAD